MDKQKVIERLNAILEHELAGVVRYTHYSLMVFGHARIPIIGWLRTQSLEAIGHAQEVGEQITTLGGHPSLKIARLLETHKHNMDDILSEALEHERDQVGLYRALLEIVTGNVTLEDYAREKIREEEAHISEVEKMLRKPGDLSTERTHKPGN